MAKKPDTFVPELDGKGRVICPVDAKTLKRINARPKNTKLADKLREALRKRA
jgi:hypothetical protein